MCRREATDVRRRRLLLTRGELLDLIAEDVKATVQMLADTVLGAGLDRARLDGIWLAGGWSELPLVSTLIAEGFGRRPIARRARRSS
jgi:molecular chaperone DnaK (HSP70)